MFQTIIYEKYVDINQPHFPLRVNYRIPTAGRSVRIVDLEGNRIKLSATARKHGKIRLVTKKYNYLEQMEHALNLVTHNFALMEAHQRYKQGKTIIPPVTPAFEIGCRDREDFQAGNWSRFSNIWLIYISM